MKSNPIGINFETEVLQYVKDEKNVGESQSKAVNRLLRVAMEIKSCNKSTGLHLDDMARDVLLKFMQFFDTVKFTQNQVNKFKRMFKDNDIELEYIEDMFAEVKK